MRHPRSIAAVIAMLLVPSAKVAVAQPLRHVSPLPASLEAKVQSLAAELRAQGLGVARGYWKTFDVDECKWAINVMGNCYGNNPTAPYVIPILPPWRDEHVDRGMHLAFGPVHRGFMSSYRLGAREAIVVLAQSPPPGAYFGLQTYVLTRKGAISREDPVYRRVMNSAPEMEHLLFGTAPDPSRVVVFSSIGNSNNDVSMRRPDGSFWNQERFIVITPDEAMKDALTAALLRAGVGDPDQIFVEPVSPDLVHLGHHADADDFITVMRYAMPDAPALGARWREDLPLAVLRVRDPRTSTALVPYGVPAYDTRSAGSEQALVPALNALTQAVWSASRVGPVPQRCVKAFVDPYRDIDLVGQHCLARPMNCLGDTQDTDTYRISPPFTLDPPGKMVAVVGSLATATGGASPNATYVSLAVNRFSVLQGVINVSHLDLAPTARAFGVTSGSLYAVYLARECPADIQDRCISVSEGDIPAGEIIKLMQRNYIKVGSARGPDPGTPDDLSTPYVDERIGNEMLLRPRLIFLDPSDCP
jgi:hypothetical protein